MLCRGPASQLCLQGARSESPAHGGAGTSNSGTFRRRSTRMPSASVRGPRRRGAETPRSPVHGNSPGWGASTACAATGCRELQFQRASPLTGPLWVTREPRKGSALWPGARTRWPTGGMHVPPAQGQATQATVGIRFRTRDTKPKTHASSRNLHSPLAPSPPARCCSIVLPP
jgi:hypothetical protein